MNLEPGGVDARMEERARPASSRTPVSTTLEDRGAPSTTQSGVIPWRRIRPRWRATPSASRTAPPRVASVTTAPRTTCRASGASDPHRAVSTSLPSVSVTSSCGAATDPRAESRQWARTPPAWTDARARPTRLAWVAVDEVRARASRAPAHASTRAEHPVPHLRTWPSAASRTTEAPGPRSDLLNPPRISAPALLTTARPSPETTSRSRPSGPNEGRTSSARARTSRVASRRNEVGAAPSMPHRSSRPTLARGPHIAPRPPPAPPFSRAGARALLLCNLHPGEGRVQAGCTGQQKRYSRGVGEDGGVGEG